MASKTKRDEVECPSSRILFRSKQCVELYTLDGKKSEKNAVTLVKGLSTMHLCSPDGSKVLIYRPSDGVRIVNLDDQNLNGDDEQPSIPLEGTKGVQLMSFSCKGSYILTWEKPSKDSPNLKVWSASNGKFLHGLTMRVCRRSQWPPLRWTHDEKKAFFMATNELHVYEGHVFSEDEVRYTDKVRCAGISSFSLPEKVYLNALGDKYLISTFVPETKGKPARVSLARYPDKCGTAENPKSGLALVTKSFYQAEECTVKWSPKGCSALVLTSTSVDTSGESYYGSTNLYLLLSESRTGGGEGLSVPLPVSKPSSSEPPVVDVAWMPNPTKPTSFAVISGRMPTMASLHNGSTGEASFLFGNAHRNTIIWSNHGRFVTLGGFGNLAGGMDFYDKNKLKKMPQYDPNTGADLGSNGNTASCAVGYGWSPCCRYFMVSTTTPRMNVDNGVTLYKYNGLEIPSRSLPWNNSKFLPNLLLAAEFVPAPEGVFPDRPQSPPPKRIEGTQGSSVLSAPTAYVPPVGRYVPPSARKGGMSLADRMRKEKDANTLGATKVVQTGVVGGKKLPVGMAPDSGKSKNALRKERQRLAKQKIEAEAKEEEERKAKEEKERTAAAASDPVKRTKKLKKIMKQIEELKKKDKSVLNEDQLKKLASEQEIIVELKELSLE